MEMLGLIVLGLGLIAFYEFYCIEPLMSLVAGYDVKYPPPSCHPMALNFSSWEMFLLTVLLVIFAYLGPFSGFLISGSLAVWAEEHDSRLNIVINVIVTLVVSVLVTAVGIVGLGLMDRSACN